MRFFIILCFIVNLNASENNWFFSSVKKHMTNKQNSDSLVLKAVGKNIDSLKIVFEIWTNGIKTYNENWQSIYYFEYDDPYDQLSYSYKETKINEELNSFFRDQAFSIFNYKSLNYWPDEKSEIFEYFEHINWYSNFYYAFDSLSNSGLDRKNIEGQATQYADDVNIQRNETLNFWNSLAKSKPLTFSFFSGGEYDRTIVWDKNNKRFIVIWSCC